MRTSGSGTRMVSASAHVCCKMFLAAAVAGRFRSSVVSGSSIIRACEHVTALTLPAQPQLQSCKRFPPTPMVLRLGQTGCGGVTGGAIGTFTCQFSAIAPIKDNQYVISYDRSMRQGKDTISGRWFWDEGSVAKPYGTDTTLTNPRTDTQWNRFLAITETHQFSSTVVNEVRLGYSRFLFANIPTDTLNLSDVGATRGNSSQFPGIYRVAVTG